MAFGASDLSASMEFLGVFRRTGFPLNFKCLKDLPNISSSIPHEPFQFQLGVHNDIGVH